MAISRFTVLSRRELMRNGLLLSAVSGLAPGIAAARVMPAEVWIVDDELQAAGEVVAAAKASAAEPLQFTADPGPVWMRTLEPRLKRSTFAIGGYTNAAVLFCLHYLARDYGLTLTALGEGAGIGEDTNLRAVHGGSADALIDLRDPRFADRHKAYTWLMSPRRV